jgi:hypothetical protein
MKKKLIEITPEKFRCGEATPTCPAVFQSNAGTYLIIASAVNLSEHPGLKHRIGTDETLIEISAELLEGALRDAKIK